MSSVRSAVFKNKKNTLSVERYGDGTVYRYVYSDDISGSDFSGWPIVYAWDSGAHDLGSSIAHEKNPLTVKSVNMKVPLNTSEHHTNKFAMCKSEDNPQLVVRRGQSFNIDIQLSRPYDLSSDNIRLIFETGDSPKINKGTEVVVDLSQSQENNKWRAKIASVQDNIVSVDITPPADCFVARWRFAIHLAKRQGSDTFVYFYQHPTHIYILFNPWCEEDAVYFAEEALLSEYILNSQGIIFMGTNENITTKAWNYSQFDQSILDICLDVLEIANLNWSQRGCPVIMTRSIASVVNYQDNFGILYGKWGAGDYSDGDRATSWTGSFKILEQFSRTKKSVRYAQCWVFAAVSVTITRALGLPSRCITNFESAHDSDGSLTIDVYLDANGVPIPDKCDTFWNFHVWNEAWMARRDLPTGYGGWQAFDSTPQGKSDAMFRRGPVSVKALKEGEVMLPYDGAFHFAEVNGNVYYFRMNALGITEVARIEMHAIGKSISTKAVNSNEREDVTDNYKYAEGSEEEKAVVLKAGQMGSTVIKEDVEITLVSEPKDRVLGSTFVLSLVMKNKSNEQRTVSHGHIIVSSMFYTGTLSNQLKKLNFEQIVLNPGEEKSQTVEVSADEYYNKLEAFNTLIVCVTVKLLATTQHFITQKTFSLLPPVLTIKGPTQAFVNKPSHVEVSIDNPYKGYSLTDCCFHVDGVGFFFRFDAGNLNPGATLRTLLEITPTTAGEQEIIVAFHSNEMKGISGQSMINIQEN